jgi:hypothetical protein
MTTDTEAVSLPPNLLPAVRMAGPGEADRYRDEFKHQERVTSWDTATRYMDELVRYFEQIPNAHRILDFDCFTSSWAGAQWRDLYTIDRKACQWAKQTLLITFTGSYYLDEEGEIPMPPITYFTRLQESTSARQQSLSRVLDHVSRWQSIRVVGYQPNREYSSYPVLFLGLYLSSPIEKENLRSVLKSHTDNCCIADWEPHQVNDAISIKSDPSHKSELVRGLGKRVPGLKSNNGITAEPWDRRAVATVLHAGNWRCCRFGRSI